MSIRKRIRKFVGKVARIFSDLPHGTDVSHDMEVFLPTLHVDLVFDVGANTGQSAERFLICFPDARLFCFEPVRDTFVKLQSHYQDNARVKCFRLALSMKRGKGSMILKRGSDLSSLVDPAKEVGTDASSSLEEVDVITIDGFCEEAGVDRINYLKIDTEGGDLDVLQGADRMLTEQRIDLVEVEAGMNPQNKTHVSFEQLKHFFENHHYFLFGIYEQFYEWPTKEPHLRRVNPVFISQTVIQANKNRRVSR